jgi:RND family efflux transporter MFP subunit
MKLRKRITTVLIIVALVTIVAYRLISNKRSFEDQLKMVSELNTTIPVLTDTVKYRQITNGFSINGTFSPFKEISITSETQGKITSLRTETGDEVKKGDTLATIDNEIFASQLAVTKFNLEKTEKDLKRFKELTKGEAATIQQYESVKQVFENAQFAYTSARVQNDNAFITAPFRGFITKRYIENGAYIVPGSPVYDIVEIEKLKLIAKLTADEVGKVRKGENVMLTTESFPGISYKGYVGNIVIKADLSGRYEVEVYIINNNDNLIKPGMYGKVLFAIDLKEPALVIPRRAIEGSILNPEIYLVSGDSVIKKDITASSLDDKYVLVKSGLKKGDVVVTSGQINLVNGSKIRIKN